MAVWQATNVMTGAVELPKFNATGDVTEIWSVALTTALAVGDTVNLMTLPANCYLSDLIIDSDKLDSGTGIKWNLGVSGTAAAFYNASTVSQAGGVAQPNVNGTFGYSQGANTQLIATVATAATTPIAGTFRVKLTYTASP